MSRWIAFFIAVAIGIGGGLVYGWVVDPVKYVDTAPDVLRIDYRSDYVLMVAEAYHADGNLALAVRRLALLGQAQPVELTNQAIQFGEQQGYAEADLAILHALDEALKGWNPVLGTLRP